MTHEATEAQVLSRREGAAWRITLNRPRAINALGREMLRGIEQAIADARGASVVVLDGAGERGFCGGGDIKEISAGGGEAVLAAEYTLDLVLARSEVPVVGFMEGITMGGGIGLTGHARFRVVTEGSRLAMPETRIGIVPDAGGHLLLARAPGRLGELLAVTAGEMDGADAIALGFADYFVPSQRLEELKQALVSGEDPAAACLRFSEPAPASRVLAAREWWDPIAESALGDGHDDPESDPAGAAQRLIAALEASSAPEAAETAATIRRVCPSSVAVTLAQLDRTRRLGLDLQQVLADDLRILGRMTKRPDFTEGVRAQVIDKDRNPRWSPARIEDLDPAELAEILAPEGE